MSLLIGNSMSTGTTLLAGFPYYVSKTALESGTVKQFWAKFNNDGSYDYTMALYSGNTRLTWARGAYQTQAGSYIACPDATIVKGNSYKIFMHCETPNAWSADAGTDFDVKYRIGGPWDPSTDDPPPDLSTWGSEGGSNRYDFITQVHGDIGAVGGLGALLFGLGL